MALPDAIVFDMDGTLTDSEETWEIVRREMAQADGLTWMPEWTTAMMGMNTPEWAAYMVDVVGFVGTPQEVARRTIGAMQDAYATGRIPVLDGAAEAVRRMAALAPLAVASSSPPELIDAGLSLLGVDELIGVRVSTETVGRGKPAPDGYLAACRLLSVDPYRAVAVEDSTNGLTSALAAGMKAIAVPPRFHPPQPEALARAHAVIDRLDLLTADLVQDLFA